MGEWTRLIHTATIRWLQSSRKAKPLKDSPQRTTRDALKVIYLVTLGGAAGLLLGGSIIGAADLDDGVHALLILMWSSTWLGALAWLCFREQTPTDSGLKTTGINLMGVGVLVGLLGMPIASIIAGAVRELLDLDPINPQLNYILIEGAPLWITICIGICVVFIQPLIEEILYRGALYSVLREVYGKWPAILSSSLLFGVMHGDIAIAAGTAALGLLFAILRESSGSIIPAYLAHVVNNGLAFILVHLG